MPKLRRLSGDEVIKILEDFGFEVIKIRGSHHKLRRLSEEDKTKQTLTVPVHGRKELAIGTLRAIYRAACEYISEEELEPLFYTE